MDELLEYLTGVLEPDEPIEPETELFSSGLLDSVLMIGLIMFIEQKCGIQVRAEDVTLDNFDTPERIKNFVESAS
ncbi:phosphopantetheine-binding protein [Defluviimonas sp. WL0002]|uniref:Phosphopantetheine-binding protein n=1 Tax=Albidovulum marisflavi TaxID=2984159 RepID=A0ABT2ZEL9_9RHOB|nr:phosphopantetheine-binding protein [Defluviimonas sp. WL0002]MCV2869493.1 phosphopantetheine-binding protein [Defluviimonas sp. WL0002]